MPNHPEQSEEDSSRPCSGMTSSIRTSSEYLLDLDDSGTLSPSIDYFQNEKVRRQSLNRPHTACSVEMQKSDEIIQLPVRRSISDASNISGTLTAPISVKNLNLKI